jgi:hypothetical protein
MIWLQLSSESGAENPAGVLYVVALAAAEQLGGWDVQSLASVAFEPKNLIVLSYPPVTKITSRGLI